MFKFTFLCIFLTCLQLSLFSAEGAKISKPNLPNPAENLDNLLTQPLNQEKINKWNKFLGNIEQFILDKGHEVKDNEIIKDYDNYFKQLQNISTELITALNNNFTQNVKPALANEPNIALSHKMIIQEKIRDIINPDYQEQLIEIAKKIEPEKIRLDDIKKEVTQLSNNLSKNLQTIKTFLSTTLSDKEKSSSKTVKKEAKAVLKIQIIILKGLKNITNNLQTLLQRTSTDLKTLEIIQPFLLDKEQKYKKAQNLIATAEQLYKNNNKEKAWEKYIEASLIFQTNGMAIDDQTLQKTLKNLFPDKYKEPDWSKSPYEKPKEPAKKDLTDLSQSLEKLTKALKTLNASL